MTMHMDRKKQRLMSKKSLGHTAIRIVTTKTQGKRPVMTRQPPFAMPYPASSPALP